MHPCDSSEVRQVERRIEWVSWGASGVRLMGKYLSRRENPSPAAVRLGES